MTIKTYTRYADYTDDVEFAVINKEYNGQRYCLVGEWKKLEQHEPATSVLKSYEGPNQKEILQSILDAAWEMGLRPTGFKDIQNETTAIKKHLDDMRMLVFASHTPYNIVELDK